MSLAFAGPWASVFERTFYPNVQQFTATSKKLTKLNESTISIRKDQHHNHRISSQDHRKAMSNTTGRGWNLRLELLDVSLVDDLEKTS
jgi:hypothetical protein